MLICIGNICRHDKEALVRFTFPQLFSTDGLRHIALYCAFIGILTSILILVYRPEPLVYIGYYLAGQVYCTQAAFFAWANVVCHDDTEERAIVLASMNLFSNAANAWWSIVFYSANFAPRFKRGMWAMIGVSVALAAWALAIRWFQERDRKRADEARLKGEVDEGMEVEGDGMDSVK